MSDAKLRTFILFLMYPYFVDDESYPEGNVFNAKAATTTRTVARMPKSSEKEKIGTQHQRRTQRSSL